MWCFGKSSLDFTRLYLFRLNSELGDLGLFGKLEKCRIHIYIKIEAMGGHGTSQKFIFLAIFMFSLLQKCS